ncbi:glycosyltransferase family 2 protein [Haloechinothrix sp. LS1_15]|uniref:glycosyltransferase family 2 protein n=1 Tax=Haloechinothrix sp. LS1_15 TaxID=2652248 RepID=UPI002947643F|nr:glycosyltransferase family 2 protein [Haloechinothrix sp. LS1_15]MDV6013918.1 glycosyltransferase family 2 protein [Haloechinothrix sp. LS1_15]
MATGPRTSIVIVTWQGHSRLAACLDAVAAQCRPHQTIVVDNASTDGTADVLDSHPSRPRVIRLSRNTGYAGGIAAALPVVDTPFVAWLNDDALPKPDWLAELEDALLADPGAAAASACLTGADGTVLSLGVRLCHDGHGADITSIRNPYSAQAAPVEPVSDTGATEVFGFCGGAALLRTAALSAAGGVPAEFFCYYEDTDTAWRLRLAGWRVLAVPTARASHQQGASTRPGSPRFHLWNERNRLLMLARCAPAGVAAGQHARFAALTLLLPLRALRSGHAACTEPNFRAGVRLAALTGAFLRLVPALRARRGQGPSARRRQVWRRWAGR